MVFQWNLSVRKSLQVSKTLLSILADLKSLYQSFGDCATRTNYNWYNRLFHVPQFFNSLARSRYLFLFSLSFNVTLWSAWTAKSTILQVLSFLLIIIRSGRQAEIRWSFVSQNPIGVCVSFSRTGLCIYHLFVCSNFNFLHNSLWITLFTQSCLVLYSFCANLLHSLIITT